MEELKLNLTSDNKEIIIRTGDAPKAKNPVKVSLSGNIYAPLAFCKKRGELLSESLCNMVVNHEKGTIILTDDEESETATIVTGSLEAHPHFAKWGINGNKTYSSLDLAQMVKMNRFMFPSTQEAMSLVAIFQNLKIKVEKELELSDDKRGNASSKRAQVVMNMSIPEKFTINVPLFKGFDPINVEVEISINAETLEIQLISPQANDIIESTKEGILKEEAEKIEILVPSMPIIHQ